jgi:DJ-1/PfpI family
VQSVIKQANSAGKPMAVICRAPRGLVPGGLARGRTLTSYHTLWEDLRNAGAPPGSIGRRRARQPGDQPATRRRPRPHLGDAHPFCCGSRGVMETILAIVAAVAILAVVFLGIFLVLVVIGLIAGFF